ncbi:hypothetical protein D3C74_429720 [compost metagenome]
MESESNSSTTGNGACQPNKLIAISTAITPRNTSEASISFLRSNRSATVPATDPNKKLTAILQICTAAMLFALPVVCNTHRLIAIPLKQSPNTEIP